MKAIKIDFSAETKATLLPAFKDYMNHYRAENMKVACSYDTSKSLADKEAMINKAIDAEVNKLSNVNCSDVVTREQYATNPVYRWATFAVINKLVDYIMPEIVRDDFLGVAGVTNIAYGDSVDFEIKSNDLFTVVDNGNSRRHVEAQRQFNGTKTLAPTNHSLTVEVDWYRVVSRRESLAEYAVKVVLSMENELWLDVMAIVANSYSTLTTNFKEAAYSSVAFDKLAQRVTAANGGATAIALGTKLGLGTVIPSNTQFQIGLGERMADVGYLGRYHGTDLIAIPQRIDWSSADYDFAIDDTIIYFISPGSQKLVQIVLEGDSLTIDSGDFGDANLTRKMTMHKRWAVGLITNAKYGIMKTSIS